jgi:hypothetical protein
MGVTLHSIQEARASKSSPRTIPHALSWTILSVRLGARSTQGADRAEIGGPRPSPCVLRFTSLPYERRHAVLPTRSILARTAFIEPDSDPYHRHGAYDESRAFLCSEPVERTLYGVDGVLASLARVRLPTADDAQNRLVLHIQGLASTLAGFEEQVGIDYRQDSELARQIQTILRFVSATNLTWLVAAIGR